MSTEHWIFLDKLTRADECLNPKIAMICKIEAGGGAYPIVVNFLHQNTFRKEEI